MAHYGTAASVKTRTGVKPDDLGLDDDAALTTFLDELLDEASDLMNRRMRRSWNDELEAGTIASIPAGLSGIANDIVVGSLRDMLVTRQSPVVRIDDFAVRTVSARVFSPDILARLRLYGRSGASTLDVSTGLSDATSATITAADLNTMDD